MDPKKIMDSLLHFIKSSSFVHSVLLLTGVTILFGDQNFLKTFGLDAASVAGRPRSFIGLVTVIAGVSLTTLLLCKIGKYLYSKIEMLQTKRKTVEKLKNLSELEKVLLFQSVITNMPVVGASADNPIAVTLLNRGIITTNMATAMNNMFEIPEVLWVIIRKEKKVIFSELINLSEEEFLRKFREVLDR